MTLIWAFYLLFLGWVGYAGYRLWTTPAGTTARVSAVVLAALTAIGTVRNMADNGLFNRLF